MKYEHELVLKFNSDFEFELDKDATDLLGKAILSILRLGCYYAGDDVKIDSCFLECKISKAYETYEEELTRLRALEKRLIEEGKIK